MKRGATFKKFQTFFSEAEQYLEQKNYSENFLWGGTGISPVLPRPALYLFAREEIFSLSGPYGQIGTRSLHQGGDIFLLGPVDSHRDWIYLLERKSLCSRATSVREGLDLFTREKFSCLQDQQIQIGTRHLCSRSVTT